MNTPFPEYSSPLSESDLSELTTSPLVEPYLLLPTGNRQSIAHKLEQRVPDLLYHKPESSSTESSPDVDRRIYHIPGRTRNGIKTPQNRPDVSDSQDSNSEDNLFSYDTKVNKAVLYSDGLEFSEAECDRDRRYKYIQGARHTKRFVRFCMARDRFMTFDKFHCRVKGPAKTLRNELPGQ